MASLVASKDSTLRSEAINARFAPYKFSTEISFSALFLNLVKYVANQFISFGNYLDKTFSKIENPAEEEKKIVEVAKAAAVATPQVEKAREKPLKKDTPQDCLRKYLNNILVPEDIDNRGYKARKFKDVDFSETNRRLFDPQKVMPLEIWNKLLDNITLAAWKKGGKDGPANETFKKEIQELVASSFGEQDYALHFELYMHSAKKKAQKTLEEGAKLTPKEKKDAGLSQRVEKLDQSAFKLGIFAFASQTLLYYFGSEYLSTDKIESFLCSLDIPCVDQATFVVLWGLTLYHTTSLLGIERPSLEQVKKTMKNLFSQKPAETLKKIAQSITFGNVLSASMTGFFTYIDRYYGSVMRSLSSCATSFIKNRFKQDFKKEDLQLRYEHKVSQSELRVRKWMMAAQMTSFGCSVGWNVLYGTTSLASAALSRIGGLFK